MGVRTRHFQFSDVAQQFVGAFFIAGPFIISDEVWQIASNVSWFQTTATVGIVFLIGYAALYQADDDREPDREASVIGLPYRFVSLLVISFSSVGILALLFGSPWTFVPAHNESVGTAVYAAVTIKAVSICAMFSVVGASTADSLF